MSNYRVRSDCRLCGSSRLEKVLDLGSTPLANELPKWPLLTQESFPLWLAECQKCGHVQLPVVVDPERLFQDYVYVSGTSPVFVEHFRTYAAELAEKHLKPGDLVVEIGSNDGTLLHFLQDKHGAKVLGVDPAVDIAKKATESGVETWSDFFTAETADRIVAKSGRARAVVANNVFAHVDDMHGLTAAIHRVLEPLGVFVFEVSYLPDVLSKTLVDTVYHEHLAYHSLGPLVPFFDEHEMNVIDAKRVPTHGGSIRVTVQKRAGLPPCHEVGPNVQALIAEEALAGLWRGTTPGVPFRQPGNIFPEFANVIDDRRGELRRLLRGAKMGGKTIAGYGAPAKATTLLHTFDLHRGVIDFIVDDSPLKQGRYMPGSDIPILPSEEIANRKPDYVVIFAWNFAYSILGKLEPYIARGGKVVVPLPKVVVY